MLCFDITCAHIKYTINWDGFHSFAKLRVSSRINSCINFNVFTPNICKPRAQIGVGPKRGGGGGVAFGAIEALRFLPHQRKLCMTLMSKFPARIWSQLSAVSQELINVTEPAQSGLEMSIWILAASPDTAPTAECGWTTGKVPSGI